MRSLHDCAWILGLPEYRGVELERNGDGRLVIGIERRGIRRYVWSGCGRRTGRVRSGVLRLAYMRTEVTKASDVPTLVPLIEADPDARSRHESALRAAGYGVFACSAFPRVNEFSAIAILLTAK